MRWRALATVQSTRWPASNSAWCRPNASTPDDDPNRDQSGRRSPLRALSLAREPAECAVYADYGLNYLTPVDLVVKDSETSNICIKARFTIKIRVEEAQMMPAGGGGGEQAHAAQEHVERPILGYVPMEHVLMVEESCPESFTKPKLEPEEDKAGGTTQTPPPPPPPSVDSTANTTVGETNRGTENNKTRSSREAKETEQEEEDDELELIVTFECGKLSFTFKRDKTKVYVSAIRGVVKLDKKVAREFIAIRPMFLTSDLAHHFKYDDEIIVVSEVQSGAHILTAMFYFTEFEAFRDSTSRDFVKPPDENSKPFPDEPDPLGEI